MPAWIAAALRILAAAGLFTVGQELSSRAIQGPEQFPGQLRSQNIIEGDFVHVGGHRRRRPRRRALTMSDKADIGFIAGMISKAAAKDFAMIIAART